MSVPEIASSQLYLPSGLMRPPQCSNSPPPKRWSHGATQKRVPALLRELGSVCSWHPRSDPRA